MKTELKDVLHLYLGCECKQSGQDNSDELFKITGISYDDTQKIWWVYFEGVEECYAQLEDVFPVLRPLSDMTEEEEEEIGINKLYHIDVQRENELFSFYFHPREFIYLLKQGFDLFGLIESRQAIDKTTLNTPKP